MEHVLALALVYLVPALILFHFAVDTFFRNPGKAEFQLAGFTLVAVFLMFVEEFVRQTLPLSYSPAMVAYGFGNFGALTAALSSHFYFKISGVAKRMPSWLYLFICYVLLVPSLLTLALRHNIYNSTDFHRVGLWIQPVYNTQYYTAMIIGIIVISAMTLLIHFSVGHAPTKAEEKRRRTIFYASLFLLVWDTTFGVLPGLVSSFSVLPPYPYIFGELGWLTVLRWAMSRHELLPAYAKRYKTLFNLVPAAILVADLKGNVLEANPIAQQMFGPLFNRLKDLVIVKTDSPSEFRQLLDHPVTNHGLEVNLVRVDGEAMAALINVDVVEVDERMLSIWVIGDITDRKLAEQQMEHMAYYDSLTDLPNRAHFFQLLESKLQQRPQPAFAVVVVDVDNFKEINDSFGHFMGDKAIQEVAQALEEALQPGDTAARLGGDEFVMMLQVSKQRDELIQTVRQLLQRLERTIVGDGIRQSAAGLDDAASALQNAEGATRHSQVPQELTLSVSVGVALYPHHGQTADALVQSADIAMYQAKHSGGNQFILFSKQIPQIQGKDNRMQTNRWKIVLEEGQSPET